MPRLRYVLREVRVLVEEKKNKCGLTDCGHRECTTLKCFFSGIQQNTGEGKRQRDQREMDRCT